MRKARLLFQPLAPVIWFPAMMLNRDDNDYVSSRFVNNAVWKSMNLATACAV